MKVQYSPLLSQASGSCGDITASRNRYGSYFKSKGGGSAAGSPYWEFVRDNNQAIMTYWSTLSYAQKMAWQAASDYHLKSYSFGNQSTLPGYNYFLSCNNNLLLCGQAIIDTPPPYGVAEMPDNVSLSTNVSTQSLILSYNNTLSNDYYTKIFITAPVKSGVTWYNNKLRFLQASQSNDIAPADLSAHYAARFAVPFEVGHQIFVKLVNFNTEFCAQSQPFVKRFEIAA